MSAFLVRTFAKRFPTKIPSQHPFLASTRMFDHGQTNFPLRHFSNQTWRSSSTICLCSSSHLFDVKVRNRNIKSNWGNRTFRSSSFLFDFNSRSLSTVPDSEKKDQIEKKTTLEKMKAMWHKYGWTFVGIYGSMYVSGLLGLYLSLEYGGFDGKWMLDNLDNVVEYVGLGEYLPIESIDPRAGNFAVAWITLKISEPLRFVLTASITPTVAKWVTPKIQDKAVREIENYKERKAIRLKLKDANIEETAAFYAERDAEATDAIEARLQSEMVSEDVGLARVRSRRQRLNDFLFTALVRGRSMRQTIRYKFPLVGQRAQNWRKRKRAMLAAAAVPDAGTRIDETYNETMNLWEENIGPSTFLFQKELSGKFPESSSHFFVHENNDRVWKESRSNYDTIFLRHEKRKAKRLLSKISKKKSAKRVFKRLK